MAKREGGCQATLNRERRKKDLAKKTEVSERERSFKTSKLKKNGRKLKLCLQSSSYLKIKKCFDSESGKTTRTSNTK